MPAQPTGTVTFLFTEIEGSTRRWEAHPQAMQAAFAHQEAIVRNAIEANGGYAYKMIGDAFQAAFPTAPQALQAAIDAQHSLYSASWPAETGEVRVRMALHAGATEERGNDYVGPALNRVARLLSAGHGGQVLLSAVTQELVRDTLPPGVTLLDMDEHRLKDLIRPEQIFQLVVNGLPSEFPPLKTLDNRPNNFPLQPTPLIGREKELADVAKMLEREEVRLVTLTGPGGIGKTRLGLQLASEALDDYHDGAWFVDLSPLMDSGLVVSTIASVLGVKEAGGDTPIIDTLKKYLKDKSMLLVLDNFEQVADAAPQVSQLLASCPHLKVLVTSRVPLSIRGEKEYPVPPLSVPDVHDVHHLLPLERLTQYEAVRLFIERATDVKPDFQVTNDNAPAVAEICARLDGLPLAIELAAARVRMLSPEALLSRLSQRLRVLTGGAKDLPERQQTLRNTIEWSYDLLEEGEKQLFRRMAPFSGGRSLEALEAVCNYDGQLGIDVFEGTALLLSKNLLREEVEVEGSGGEPRFWMLETIHEYAREKLQESGEGEALHREHALYFMRLAEEAEPHLIGREQREWLDRLEEEYDNLRAALGWARGTGEEAQATVRGEAREREGVRAEEEEVGLRIACSIWRFWNVRGYFSEGREQLRRVLEGLEGLEGLEEWKAKRADADTVDTDGLAAYRAKAKALNGAGALAHSQGDYGAARSLYEESLAIRRELGDKGGIPNTLHNLGNVAYLQGDYATARSLNEESLAISRELGDKWGISYSLNTLGLVAYSQGDYGAARSLYEESLAIRRELGDKRGIAISLNDLGIVAYLQGDYAAARSLCEESLALFREIGEKRGIGMSLKNLGLVTQQQGDYAAARSLCEESLALSGEMGDKWGIANSLAGLGGVLVDIGQTQRGVVVLGAVEALLESMGIVLDREDREPYERAVSTAHARLGIEGFEKAWQEGRGMSMEEAVEYALQVS